MEYDFLLPLECILNSHIGKVAVFLFLLYLWKELTMGLFTAKTRLEGKVAVVTGGNAGIGFETAKELAARGARVIIGCRSRTRGEDAVRKIISSTGNKEVFMIYLDLSDLQTVRKFAEYFCEKEDRLDILVNNAGIVAFAYKSRVLSKDNLEVVVQTNHLGHFLLTNLLKKPLTTSGSARVVNVSSQKNALYTDKDEFDVRDMLSEKAYDIIAVYTKSKLLNILFANELARRWKPLGVSSFSLHPGLVRTEIFNTLPAWAFKIFTPVSYLVWKSCYQGAQTTLHCCLQPGLEEDSGSFWVDCRIYNEANSGSGNIMVSERAWDSRLAEEIWGKSANLVKLSG